MKNILYSSIIFLCVTISVCAIVYTHRNRVVVTYTSKTATKGVVMDIKSGSIESAIDDIQEIDSLWTEQRNGPFL